MSGRTLQRGLRAAATVLTRRPPTDVLYFAGGIGDELLCTAVAREIRARRPRARVWMASERPELFAGNGDFAATLPRSRWMLATLAKAGAHVAYPGYPGRDPATTARPTTDATSSPRCAAASACARGASRCALPEPRRRRARTPAGASGGRSRS